MGGLFSRNDSNYTPDENIIRNKLIDGDKIKKTDPIDTINHFKSNLDVNFIFESFRETVKAESDAIFKHKIILRKNNMNGVSKLFMGSSSTPYGFATSTLKIGPFVR
jgi:hypothetical protein